MSLIDILSVRSSAKSGPNRPLALFTTIWASYLLEVSTRVVEPRSARLLAEPKVDSIAADGLSTLMTKLWALSDTSPSRCGVILNSVCWRKGHLLVIAVTSSLFESRFMS